MYLRLGRRAGRIIERVVIQHDLACRRPVCDDGLGDVTRPVIVRRPSLQEVVVPAPGAGAVDRRSNERVGADVIDIRRGIPAPVPG